MEESDDTHWVWVFNGAGARFPSGIFESRQAAEAWIRSYHLNGMLTRYPLDHGVYDWAVLKGFFRPKQPKPEHSSSKFIQSFTSAALEHYHYGNDANEAEMADETNEQDA